MNNIDKGSDKVSEIEILDIKSNITPKDYLANILEFSKETTPENSIVFDFEIDANYCHCKATKYDIDGSKEELKEETFDDINTVITELVEPFLKHFADINKIVINNISPYKEETSSLKIISETNDMCNIHGMDEKTTTRLSEMVRQTAKDTTIGMSQEKMDERGVGNIFAFIISFLVLGTVIIGLLIPNFLK